jgi:hypothetical protein
MCVLHPDVIAHRSPVLPATHRTKIVESLRTCGGSCQRSATRDKSQMSGQLRKRIRRPGSIPRQFKNFSILIVGVMILPSQHTVVWCKLHHVHLVSSKFLIHHQVEVITSDFDLFRSSGNPGSSPGTTYFLPSSANEGQVRIQAAHDFCFSGAVDRGKNVENNSRQ